MARAEPHNRRLLLRLIFVIGLSSLGWGWQVRTRRRNTGLESLLFAYRSIRQPESSWVETHQESSTKPNPLQALAPNTRCRPNATPTKESSCELEPLEY